MTAVAMRWKIVAAVAVAGVLAAAGVVFAIRPWEGDATASLPERVCWGSVDSRRVAELVPDEDYKYSEFADVRYPQTDARCALRIPELGTDKSSFVFYAGHVASSSQAPYLDVGQGVGSPYRAAGPNGAILVSDHQAWTYMPSCKAGVPDERPRMATVTARDRGAEEKPPPGRTKVDYVVPGAPDNSAKLVSLLVELANSLLDKSGCNGERLVGGEIQGSVDTKTVANSENLCGVPGVSPDWRVKSGLQVSTVRTANWAECHVRALPEGTLLLRFDTSSGPLAAGMLKEYTPLQSVTTGGTIGGHIAHGTGVCSGPGVLGNLFVDQDFGESAAKDLFLGLSKGLSDPKACAAGG
ncbi:hypothetical protein [Yinghuangia soli]|uniref:Uncharacterized protein n=1 Tax=Yinghuangia soli TaxID=2908204 RepID=A0AA41Q8P6_9ACTN|nr:hypothetical protein [Yinghuangia soli]MCF2533658.1 hypothetical protein [Yinghuangia soli]